MITCPNCGSIDTGRVGTNQYYCWHCFVEFEQTGTTAKHIYQVEEDGSLSSLDDLFLSDRVSDGDLM
ncbi:hypothetical protein [Rubeoparvulum massiliense]|uniref:hypothetical protein n=1 Tax=Rubeoparvulum massiliense TaxID=1631346 RepID=UPI00065E3A78|nr:hypothetical protein [Rubeoparvulum massiliense]